MFYHIRLQYYIHTKELPRNCGILLLNLENVQTWFFYFTTFEVSEEYFFRIRQPFYLTKLDKNKMEENIFKFREKITASHLCCLNNCYACNTYF